MAGLVEKVVVAVPARLQSSRLPNKVLADIGGQPMIQRVLQLRTVGAEHNGINPFGLTATLEHPLNHRLTADVSQHLVGQTRRLQPRGHRYNNLLHQT